MSVGRPAAVRAGVVVAVAVAATAVAATALAGGPAATPCAGTVYLTLDTGSMRDAQLIAEIMQRHRVKATFFIASEKTVNGDRSLDDGWAEYWRARVREGHAFGSHTFDHVYFRGVDARGRFKVRPQFGAQAGTTLSWDAPAVCAEIVRADLRFLQMTGRPLERWWRAPGGKAPPGVMDAAAGCGWAHVHWAPAGFLGDELPSDRYPNRQLLEQALRSIRNGDILMAHLGIWSRKDPYAPMLDPLIAGLKSRGLCFATLREHPEYR